MNETRKYDVTADRAVIQLWAKLGFNLEWRRPGQEYWREAKPEKWHTDQPHHNNEYRIKPKES